MAYSITDRLAYQRMDRRTEAGASFKSVGIMKLILALFKKLPSRAKIDL